MIAYFNRAAADLLGLSPSDVGRTSREIPVLAALPRLEQQCSHVINTGVDSRVDYRDADKWFVVRIAPYKKGDREVDGTVLTFTDVTAFRAGLDHAIYERECTKAIINTVADPLVVLNADQRIQSGNRAFYKMFGLSRDETQGVPLNDLGNGAFELALLREQLKEILADSDVFQSVEVPHVLTAKGERTLILDAHPLSFPGHS
ncbi:MAG TPA: PAS domain-containing protein, partial [Gemmatimonadaceae bacterium]|nr:PAS domain-containing protein [Gemmatimonadaceae bacterium]